MSLFNVFDISSSAIAAQSERLNTVASNIANAESASGPDGMPYRAKQVVFQAVPPESGDGPAKVQVAGVVEDTSAPRRVFDPKHPLADGQGYVSMPNVNIVEEMVNMILGQRAYEANSKVIRTADEMLSQVNNLAR